MSSLNIFSMKKTILIAAIALIIFACKNQQTFDGFYAPESITWAEQGWNDEERDYWHHLNAGQEFAPLSWVKALEAPDSSLSLLDPYYLRDLGFLDKPVSKYNPEGLPVGFSIKPSEKGGRAMVGLTCASCHTGQLSYQGKAFRIDGASAGFNITQFFIDYNQALGLVYEDSAAWKKFATRVLKQEPGDETQLRKEVETVIKSNLWENEAYAKLDKPSVTPGHGRMDPFNRIGNEVFGLGLREQSNYSAMDAPVGAPYLWDIARLNWVHYNASFNERVSRNILQVLGNGGRTYFLDEQGKMKKGAEIWTSSFDIKRLLEIEDGYASIKAPEWPNSIFGSVDMEKAKRGRALFMTNCAKCHAPKPILGTDPKRPQLAVTEIPLHVIGTDTNEAAGFVNRRYDASKVLGKNTPKIDGAAGLQLVTSEMANYAFDKLGWTKEQRQAASGDDRPNKVRAKAIYKARPLDGIWSTPPFLHNGSVPNLYELLSPPSERSVTFWLGSYEFDPVKVGYQNKQSKKSTLFDTRLSGNSNSGHAFTDDISTKGKIGRALSHEERLDLIEYLKVLPSLPPDPHKPVERSWD
jgi:hypothetical protein